MIDINDEVALHEAESHLDDRERMALSGYMLLKDSKADADVLAYSFSRPSPPKANDSLLRRKALDWLESDPCQAFLHLYRTRAQKLGAEGGEGLSETEIMLNDLDKMLKDAKTVEDKLKIIRVKADIRHKSRSERKDKSSCVNFFLPMRCNEKECPLYAQALRRLKAQDPNFKKTIELHEKEPDQPEMEAE